MYIYKYIKHQPWVCLYINSKGNTPAASAIIKDLASASGKCGQTQVPVGSWDSAARWRVLSLSGPCAKSTVFALRFQFWFFFCWFLFSFFFFCIERWELVFTKQAFLRLSSLFLLNIVSTWVTGNPLLFFIVMTLGAFVSKGGWDKRWQRRRGLNCSKGWTCTNREALAWPWQGSSQWDGCFSISIAWLLNPQVC